MTAKPATVEGVVAAGAKDVHTRRAGLVRGLGEAHAAHLPNVRLPLLVFQAVDRGGCGVQARPAQKHHAQWVNHSHAVVWLTQKETPRLLPLRWASKQSISRKPKRGEMEALTRLSATAALLLRGFLLLLVLLLQRRRSLDSELLQLRQLSTALLAVDQVLHVQLVRCDACVIEAVVNTGTNLCR